MSIVTVTECIKQVKKGGVSVFIYVPVLANSVPVAKGVILEKLRWLKKAHGTSREMEVLQHPTSDILIIDPRIIS